MQAERTRSAGRVARRVIGPVTPNSPRWYQRIGAGIIFALVRLLSFTIRYRWNDRSGYFGPDAGAAIYCVWHNRLALCLPIYQRYARKFSRTPGMAAMVSASKDGALLAAILECFRVQPVRGSSSRRGPQALLELTTWCERGYDLAITPDGPRGPCYEVQEGITSLAQLTGLPILPVSYSLSWKIRARSWDRFQIPLPFSRCEVFVEPPICVPRDASDSEREVLRLKLQQVLKTISKD
ncbi:MAG TPA: lysophospholipid acyltransferase family protein [Methylomirabilota bacterium]|nr:lysophospholipid acyltransferase family protein [Methylomirabilota bacterium]